MIKTGPDAFFSRIGRNMAANTVALPGAAWAVKQATAGTPIGGVHMAILAPVLGTLFKTVRGLIPV